MTTPLESSILCRAAVTLNSAATGEMMYMPGGLQTITPIAGGIEQPIQIQVDASGARELERQRGALMAKGKRPYFDFNHSDGEASFWPEEFFWRDQPEPGIYCRGEWTTDGRAKVEGKAWRQFSPVFHVDNKRANPAHIVCREWAKPNMGGLVNDPAFHSILPLWAKDAAESAATGAHPEPHHQMTPEELAALQAKNLELIQQLTALKADQAALKAKNENDAIVLAQISAKEAELKAGRAEVELAELKAKNKVQGDAIAARNKADAEAAVKRAVDRGAIAAKDEATQNTLIATATADPGFISAINAMQGNPALSGRITTPGVTIVAESTNATMKEFASLVCRNKAMPIAHETYKEKGKLALAAHALFAKSIENDPVIATMAIEDVIKAADNTNASVGLLSGTLVLMRTLPLLQYEYPVLGAITSDYSDAPGLYGQMESTRIVLKHAVQTRSTAVDSAGRPVGWNTVSPAQMVDVSVTLDEHVGVPVVFGQNVLASTVRNLFAEQAPMALYALGGYLVDKVTGLLTPTNFNAYKGITATSGATTSGSTAISAASTANMFIGQAISGTGIPSNTYIASVTDATNAVITQAATATNTGLTFTLSASKVPTTYTTYVKALADFDVASMGELKSAFDINEVPMQGRFALLNSTYHTKLGNTPTLNSFFAAVQKPDIITKGNLPEIQGFAPINAPYFPTSSNRVGFAGHKASLILKTRLPVDITSATSAQAPGSVTTISVPGGISVALVEYVSLREGYAEFRPEVMAGAAPGERRAGLVLTSQ